MSPCFFVPMPRMIHVHNLDNDSQTPLQIKYCDTFLCKLRGLMFRPELAADDLVSLLPAKEGDVGLDDNIGRIQGHKKEVDLVHGHKVLVSLPHD